MGASDDPEGVTPSPSGGAGRGLVRRLLEGLRGVGGSSPTPIPTRLGRYRVLERIGQGGMGVVFAAHDERLGRRVAIKIIAEPDDAARKRFRREALAAAAVNHPNVCQVYDIDEDSGQLFIAMELLSGEPLSDRLARGRLPSAEVISIGRGVLGALAALHDAGIVHRDLKPSNVFLTSHGVKLLDFGLARPLSSDLTRPLQESTELTQPGLVVGTPRYMSPEQVLGRPVDARSDLFATAAILYEAAAGRPAFLGATVVEALSATLHDEPPPLAGDGSSAALDRVLRRALAKRPADRPESARAMAMDLHELEQGPPGSTDGQARAAPPAPAYRHSIAVLPFANMSPDPDQDYFCEGMAEDILNALTKVDGLRVVARASSFRFAGRVHDIPQIGRALGVDKILEGSVRAAGDRLRVAAQLIDVADSSHVWSERYERQKEDVFAIQDDISERIVEALRVRLVGRAPADPRRRRTEDVEAYHLYLKGQHNWYRRESDSLQKAAAFFEEAARRDPSYALAHVGVANAYSSLGYYGMEPKRSLGKARDAVARALALDPALPEALAAQGLMQLWLEWSWPEAERSLRAAIDANPEDALARCWASFLYSVVGRYAESLALAEGALAIDPLSPYVNTSVGFSLFNQGEHERAIEPLRRALEMDGDFLYTLWVLGGTCSAAGRHEEALGVLERAVTLSSRAPHYLSWLAHACGAAGRQERGLELVGELVERARGEYVAPVFFAWAYSGLGETKAALDWVERAFAERSPTLAMHHDTLLRGLRSEPRFQEVRRRMGLAP
jgi:TolB-like protein/Tfp pilus assembly protein PilF/predicted Ser/Thr protein kinase